ncbi:Sodium/proline symporter [Phycisphaerales bacterium]|nr:Sodium/proline symporter [Phycisphaerales bacterium]
MSHTNFGPIDWAITGALLVGITLAGVWFNRLARTVETFIIAGRKVRGYLGVASIIASEMGLVTVMYAAQKGFTGGFSAFHIALVAGIAALLVGLTGFIVIPLRKAGVMTIPEFYEKRFGRGARVLGGAILAFSGILNMGMYLKADSLFITALTGMESAVHLRLAMTIMLGLVLVYTALGGMISVLVTDYLQFVIMAVVLVGVSILLMLKIPWNDLAAGVRTLRGEAGFNPLAEEGFGAGYVVWMFFLGLISCAVWQTAAIRASSAEDTAAVRKTFTWGSIGFVIRFMVPYFWGICALVWIASRPEMSAIFLDKGASPETTLKAMPTALASILPTGVLGLLMAGMLAAAMSTYNTYLHAWSSVLTQDVFGAILGERLAQRGRITLARVFMLLIGVFLLVWGLWYPLGEDLWDYMAVTGAIYFTGAFAVLAAGLYWRRASRVGAYASMACGFAALTGLKPVQNLIGVQWRSEYVGLATVALAIVAMAAGSFLAPDAPPAEPERTQ